MKKTGLAALVAAAVTGMTLAATPASAEPGLRTGGNTYLPISVPVCSNIPIPVVPVVAPAPASCLDMGNIGAR